MGVLEDKGRARIFYRYLSTVYDRVNPYVWTEQMRDDTVEWIGVSPDDRVLDVGCGTGFATTALLAQTDDVHGLDQSVHQLERAWAKLGKHGPVRFVLGDAERLPYATDSFDVVWSSGSIEYWPNPVRALRELRRVCRPGGTVLVVAPNEPDNWLARKLARAVMLWYDEERADEMFADAGYEDVEHRLLGPGYKPDVAIATKASVPE